MSIKVPDVRVSDSSKAAIVRSLISESGPHPKYGVGVYSANQHDSFPPATILPSLCWLDWGYSNQAKSVLSYYLSHFVKPDGTFDYYGPALSEYGQLLALVARCVEVTGDHVWLRDNLPAIDRISEMLLAKLNAARQPAKPSPPNLGLLWGAAEADTYEDKRFYFSGNAWCWRGLEEMGSLLTDEGQTSGDLRLARLGKSLLAQAAPLRADILAALHASFQPSAIPPFLPPVAGEVTPFGRMTENDFASYTNYRYWPEMLSAGILPADLRDAVIDYRAAHGGEVAATTRLEDGLDDWPYANYAWGLLEAGQIDHYLQGFFGHAAFHQTPGTFTAYESVAIKGTEAREYSSDYCVPAQLVEPQLLRWMIAWEPWGDQKLWLGRGVPKRWFKAGFAVREIPTRWGRVNFELIPTARKLTARIEMNSPHPQLSVHVCFRSIPDGTTARVRVEGTKFWSWNPNQHVVDLWGDWNEVMVSVSE